MSLIERLRCEAMEEHSSSCIAEAAAELEANAAEIGRKDAALELAIAALGMVNTRCFDRPESPLKPIGDIAREALSAICNRLGDTVYDKLADAALNKQESGNV